MLVLSRRTGQKIVIGNEVVVDVLSVSGEGVRLGISAPSETSVHRHEVFVEIQEANRSAEIVPENIEHEALGSLAALIRTKQKEVIS